MGFGGSKLRGYQATSKSLAPGTLKVSKNAWQLQEPENLWGAQEYELTKKALRADREAEVATWHAKMHEANARMYAEYAQKAQQQAEIAARTEIQKKSPKLQEYTEYCADLRAWLTEHKERLREPDMMKNYSLCDSVDAYLNLATRDSIKATAHALGFRLVGEAPGVERDTELKAVQDGYDPGFYKLRPAQAYVPEALRQGLNPAVVVGPQRIGRLEANMVSAIGDAQQVNEAASLTQMEALRAPHQELETLMAQTPQDNFGAVARGSYSAGPRLVGSMAPLLPLALTFPATRKWQQSVKLLHKRPRTAIADFL